MHRRFIKPLNEKAFSLIEIVLTIAIFSLMSTIVISAFIYGQESTAVAGNRQQASEFANEAIEAVRNIDSASFSNLSNYLNGTTYYLTTISNQWALVTTPVTAGADFTRTITFADGPNGSRQVTATVTWPEDAVRTGSVSASTYLANWQASTAPPNKTGIIVYADGGTTTDRVAYRLLQSNGTWSAETAMPDVDSGSTNRVARSVKIYSAQTGSAKMVVSRHFDGLKQYMYATYWNGTGFTTPQLLASWTSTANLDIGNYGGGFLANGTFVVVYSDGTNVPKWRTFNGSTWSAQGSLGSMGSGTSIINMSVQARPDSNEAMADILVSNADIVTSYFSNNSWSAFTTNTTSSYSSSTKAVEFAWSDYNNTIGELVYATTSNSRSLLAQTFTANNSGGGTWSAAVGSATQPTNSNVNSVDVMARQSSATQFIACDKDNQTQPHIYCYNVTPGFVSTPANNLITSSTDSGGQRSFDLDFEYTTDNIGLNAYSDNTSVTKLKRYNTTTGGWDSTALSLGTAAGGIQKTRIVAKPNSSDAMVISADNNEDLYTVMYNGTSNTAYTTPTGYAWTNQSASGPSNNAVWFDFAWDN